MVVAPVADHLVGQAARVEFRLHRQDQRVLIVVVVPADLVVDDEVQVLGLARQVRPSLGVDAGEPGDAAARVAGLEEVVHPIGEADVGAEARIVEQARRIAGLVIDRRPEDGRIGQRPAVQKRRAADQPHRVVRIGAGQGVVVLVDDVAGGGEALAHHLERDAEAGDLLVVVQAVVERPHEALQIAVAGQEAIDFVFLVEQQDVAGVRPRRQLHASVLCGARRLAPSATVTTSKPAARAASARRSSVAGVQPHWLGVSETSWLQRITQAR